MARFVFEHEALLEQRRRAERERQVVVAQLERERMELEGVLRGAQRSLASCKTDLRDALHGRGGGARVDIGAVRMQASASFGLTARAQGVAIRLAGSMRRLEAARRELMAASAARRAVELLRERRLEQWRREQARREAAELDEIATTRAARDAEAA